MTLCFIAMGDSPFTSPRNSCHSGQSGGGIRRGYRPVARAAELHPEQTPRIQADEPFSRDAPENSHLRATEPQVVPRYGDISRHEGSPRRGDTPRHVDVDACEVAVVVADIPGFFARPVGGELEAAQPEVIARHGDVSRLAELVAAEFPVVGPDKPLLRRGAVDGKLGMADSQIIPGHRDV